MTATAAESTNVLASILSVLEVSADVVALVPKSSWIIEDAPDLPTAGLARWIAPTLLSLDGAPSRRSLEGRVLFQVNVYVRPGSDVYGRRRLADVIGRALAHQAITVEDHFAGAPLATIGHLRTFDFRYVDGGRDENSGANVGTVEIGGYLTPA